MVLLMALILGAEEMRRFRATARAKVGGAVTVSSQREALTSASADMEALLETTPAVP
jgi:hypothetical protein